MKISYLSRSFSFEYINFGVGRFERMESVVLKNKGKVVSSGTNMTLFLAWDHIKTNKIQYFLFWCRRNDKWHHITVVNGREREKKKRSKKKCLWLFQIYPMRVEFLYAENESKIISIKSQTCSACFWRNFSSTYYLLMLPKNWFSYFDLKTEFFLRCLVTFKKQFFHEKHTNEKWSKWIWIKLNHMIFQLVDYLLRASLMMSDVKR